MPLTRNGGAKVVFFSGLWRVIALFFTLNPRFFHSWPRFCRLLFVFVLCLRHIFVFSRVYLVYRSCVLSVTSDGSPITVLSIVPCPPSSFTSSTTFSFVWLCLPNPTLRFVTLPLNFPSTLIAVCFSPRFEFQYTKQSV